MAMVSEYGQKVAMVSEHGQYVAMATMATTTSSLIMIKMMVKILIITKEASLKRSKTSSLVKIVG